jgi:hypothetical protein
MQSKYKGFTDNEIYILSRQAIESSYEITMIGKYPEDEQEIHSQLLKELIDERKRRGYNVNRDWGLNKHTK